MATSRKASISAEIGANRTKWSANLATAKAEGKKFADDIGAIKGEPGFFATTRAGIGKLIGRYQHLRAAVTDIGAVAVRTAGAPAAYNDMADALTAVTGSADEAKTALDFLGAVAGEQKLEFEPLVEAYQRLRSLGYSAAETRDLIRELGNAVEFAGGSSDDLTAITDALGKITDKGDVSARQLMKMGEALPYLRKIFKDQFGAETAADMEKLSLTSKDLFDGIMRGLKEIETSKGGTLDAASPEFLASQARLRAGRALTGTNPILPDLPDRQTTTEDPETKARRVADLQARAAAEKQAQGEKELAQREQIGSLEGALEIAREDGDKDKIAALEDQLTLAKELADLMKEVGVDEKTATDFLLRRNQARREEAEVMQAVKDLAEKQRQAEGAATSLRDSVTDIAITDAETRGDKKKADKLRKQRDRDNTEKSLIAAGVDPATAAATADRKAKSDDNADYFARTGRRRIAGGRSGNTSGGLDGGLGRSGGFLTPSALATTDADRVAADARSASQGAAKGTAQSDPVLTVLNEIKAALLANKPSVADRTKSR